MAKRRTVRFVHGQRLDAGLPERLAALEALALEQTAETPTAKAAWLICDRCDARVLVSAKHGLPTGWTMGVTGDYCPDCPPNR